MQEHNGENGHPVDILSWAILLYYADLKMGQLGAENHIIYHKILLNKGFIIIKL